MKAAILGNHHVNLDDKFRVYGILDPIIHEFVDIYTLVLAKHPTGVQEIAKDVASKWHCGHILEDQSTGFSWFGGNGLTDQYNYIIDQCELVVSVQKSDLFTNHWVDQARKKQKEVWEYYY